MKEHVPNKFSVKTVQESDFSTYDQYLAMLENEEQIYERQESKYLKFDPNSIFARSSQRFKQVNRIFEVATLVNQSTHVAHHAVRLMDKIYAHCNEGEIF